MRIRVATLLPSGVLALTFALSPPAVGSCSGSAPPAFPGQVFNVQITGGATNTVGPATPAPSTGPLGPTTGGGAGPRTQSGRGVARKSNGPVTTRVPVVWEPMADTAVDSTMTPDDVVGLDCPRCVLNRIDRTHKRPFVIYLTGEDDDAKRREQVTRGAFLDERVGVAALTFCMIRGSGDSFDDDHAFARHVGGKTLPRVVVFDVHGEKVGQLEGRITGNEVLGLMQKAFRASYRDKLSVIVREFDSIMTERGQIHAKRYLLEREFATCDSASEERTIEKKLAALDEAEEKLRSNWRKLFTLDRIERET